MKIEVIMIPKKLERRFRDLNILMDNQTKIKLGNMEVLDFLIVISL